MSKVPKKNYKMTIKFISEYLGLNRNTVRVRMRRDGVDRADGNEVLDWMFFEQMGRGTKYRRFRDYVIRKRGCDCEECGEGNVQIHHVVPRNEDGTLVFRLCNVKVLCVECHGKKHGYTIDKAHKYYFDNFTIKESRRVMVEGQGLHRGDTEAG